MKSFAIHTAASAIAAIAVASSAVQAASDDLPLQRLALCQDSWVDWKDDAPRMARFSNTFNTRFNRSAQGDAFIPRQPSQVLGRAITHAYPQSVGMGVGFSLVINSDFGTARAAIEQQLGKPMRCSTSDGVRSCELQLGEQKTALLMTGQNGQADTSLVGCYYFYEK
jgi:hypothetical protein